MKHILKKKAFGTRAQQLWALVGVQFGQWPVSYRSNLQSPVGLHKIDPVSVHVTFYKVYSRNETDCNVFSKKKLVVYKSILVSMETHLVSGKGLYAKSANAISVWQTSKCLHYQC